MDESVERAPLDEQSILSSLHTHTFGRSLCILPKVDSTNAQALTLAHSQAEHGTVVVAELQTAGRGRLDRTWYSPSGLNLYTSILLRPPPHFEHLSWIPLIAGLALTESIQQLSHLPVKLKWPNDLLCHEKKLGGILCEGISHGVNQPVVIVGIGVNVHMRADDFPDDLRQTSTSLLIGGQREVNRNTLLAFLLNALETRYDQLLTDDIVPIHHAYTTQCSTLGRDLLVHLTNREEFFARGQAIGEDGSLHVCLTRSPDLGVRVIQSGDVTHLRMMSS